MALLDKLNSNQNKKRVVRGPGGQLTEVDTNELAQLSESLGMPTAPTTPLGAGALGVNPDSAKMAGTKVQKANALSLPTQPGQDLSTTIRQGQDRQVATAAEQQAATRSEYLSKLGSVGDSVFQLINRYMPAQALAQQTAPTAGQPAAYSLSVPPDLMNRLDPQTQAEMQQFALNPNLASAQVLANKLKLAGFSEAESNPLQYVQNMGSGEFLAQQLSDNTNVGELIQHGDLQQNTGLSGSAIAQLLGVTEDQLNGMSIADLRSQLDAVEQQDFSKTADLRAIISDPNTSYSERKQARQQLRDLGATGVVASEADIARLEKQLESADTVRIGDDEYTIEEFLSDDGMSRLASEYLQADTPEEKAQFQTRYGSEFVNLLEQNRALLEDAAEQLTTIRGSVSAANDFNAKIGQTTDAGSVSSQVLEALIPGYSKFSTEQVALPELVKMISDTGIPADRRANLVRGMNELGADLIDRISGLTEEQLRATGIFDNTDKWQATKSWWKTQDILSSLDPVTDKTKIEALMLGELSREEAELKLRQDRTLGVQSDWNRAVDSNNDGKLDSPEALKAQGSQLIDNKQDGRIDQMRDDTHLDEDQVLLRDVTDEILADGVITGQEFTDLFKGLEGSLDQPKIAMAFINSKSPQMQELVRKSPAVPFTAAFSPAFAPVNDIFKKMRRNPDPVSWILMKDVNFNDLRKQADALAKSNPSALGPVAARYKLAINDMEANFKFRKNESMDKFLVTLMKQRSKSQRLKYDTALFDKYRKEINPKASNRAAHDAIYGNPKNAEWYRKFQLSWFKNSAELKEFL